MKKDFINIIARIIVLFIVSTVSTAGFPNAALEKPARVRIKNFGQIDANYYRGGQPKAGEFAMLKRLGIKTVLNLRKDAVAQEPAWVRNEGMKYFNIPLLTTRPATREQTEEFLKLVRDPDNWPVYVHCAAGRHRTGALTAIYRIVCHSWTADMAYKEMKQYGYYSFPNHGSLKDFVYQYVPNASGFEGKIKSAAPAFSESMLLMPAGSDSNR
jgi:protein tyrosine/serine phosphatase